MSDTDQIYPTSIKRTLEVKIPLELDESNEMELAIRLEDHIVTAARRFIHEILVEGVAQRVRFIVT